MKRPVVEILHSFDRTSNYWLQVRFEKSHEAAATEAVNRRALSAGWDPEGQTRSEDTAETKNWLTREIWFETPLSVSKALQIDFTALETEQALIPFPAEKTAKMADTRNAFEVKRSPLFAAMGALDEVAQESNALKVMFGRNDWAAQAEVGNAAQFQSNARLMRELERSLGADAIRELHDHASRVYPSSSHHASFWQDVKRQPEATIARVREMNEVRSRPAMALYLCVRASVSICLPDETHQRLKAIEATLPDDDARLHFWRQIRDREEPRRFKRLGLKYPSDWMLQMSAQGGAA